MDVLYVGDNVIFKLIESKNDDEKLINVMLRGRNCKIINISNDIYDVDCGLGYLIHTPKSELIKKEK